jgi:hypothetical protein
MFDTTTKTLKILAALVWYTGGFILLFKGSVVLLEAETLVPDRGWPLFILFIGIVIGLIKAKYIFFKSGEKNISRINGIDSPKLWQFYKPGFFLMLFLMISVGILLLSLAHDNYPGLISVGGLNIAIAIALLVSSIVFWKH